MTEAKKVAGWVVGVRSDAIINLCPGSTWMIVCVSLQMCQPLLGHTKVLRLTEHSLN